MCCIAAGKKTLRVHGGGRKYAASNEVVLSVHELIINGTLTFTTCEDYQQLWQLYCASETFPPEVEGANISTRRQLLDGWSTWAAQQDDITEAQLELAAGPFGKEAVIKIRTRATVSGVHFRSSELDVTGKDKRQKPSVSSYFVARVTTQVMILMMSTTLSCAAPEAL